MRKHSLLVLALLMMLPGTTQAAEPTVDELRASITALAAEIIQDASTCSDAAELQRTRDTLRATREQIRLRHRRLEARQETACVEFAYDVYRRTYAGTDALRFARSRCEEPLDMAVARMAFDIWDETYAGTDALRFAVKDARRPDLAGRAACLRLNFKVYDETYASTDAWRMAKRACARD